LPVLICAGSKTAGAILLIDKRTFTIDHSPQVQSNMRYMPAGSNQTATGALWIQGA
jgi:hypothetical protein